MILLFTAYVLLLIAGGLFLLSRISRRSGERWIDQQQREAIQKIRETRCSKQ